ncbi:oligopeptide transporter 1-like [Silene latifolia]|uniref:oligopeptide transporter 1-like n=1 Tax=Silene latifolia TaxID=37657 RepID=UPI003D782B8E
MVSLEDDNNMAQSREKTHSDLSIAGEEEINDSPIEEVRLTVPITDDPTLPALTFRTWVLGLSSCIILSFVNKYFGFRENPIFVSSLVAQIAVLPAGRLMAATLPTKTFTLPFTNLHFSLNPGPFNLKEHVLITVFASSGGGVYASHIIVIVKALYKRSINMFAAMFLAQTTQLLGYGWAGLFRKYLVDSPYMWWPANLVQVSLFRTLHEKDKRQRGSITKQQFFLITVLTSFAYYVIPGYLFPSIGCLSILCWVFKKSRTMQQIGSGIHGLGVGALSFDWNVVVSFLNSPLPTPASAILNVMVGFFLIVYVVTPLSYYSNIYEAKKFPFISSKTFDQSGQAYNITRILDAKTFTFDDKAYSNYSKLYLSVFFAFSYGLSFASLTATISHVALFHGKSILHLWGKARAKLNDGYSDVHLRIMKKNYEQVPQWWYYVLLLITFGLALLACEGFNGQLQLPWWGLIMACVIAASFTLPIGIIMATTNQEIGLNVITELIIGYLYPGRPLANVSFKTYGYISMSQALFLIRDLKLGHYMKIAPKAMFIAQLVGTIVSSQVNFATSWWLLTTIENVCNPESLPKGSPWTCPGDNVFFNASIIWGVLGPARMFTKQGIYPGLNWFFLIGLLAPFPVWFLTRKYPEKKWIKLINMPIILSSTSMMPPARSINYLTWCMVGLFFNYYVYSRYKGWWARYNYILSAGLDAGVAFMGVLLYILQGNNIFGPNWWGMGDDYCPLAKCPADPTVIVKGCPTIS